MNDLGYLPNLLLWPRQLTGDVTDATLRAYPIFGTAGTAAAAIGLALSDRRRIVPLALAGILGVLSGVAVLSMVGLRVGKLVVGVWPFALSGAALGWVREGRPTPRRVVGGAAGRVTAHRPTSVNLC